ncbi:hypothetical protein BD410DRAFT_633245 [Rickenella mellea]|uniref:F-box domain-containing protein n=1 Tax=Rickenella mellea TaxID=50990 RepID=A0A4Y7QD19_9AGAM|nr:hypothetical protein BD410DRAFT_633245 [Rickenella mellea]
MMVFIPINGENMKTMTIVGTVGGQFAQSLATCLRDCRRLGELVMDVNDLARLIPLGQLLHPQVTQLSLTNCSSTALPSGNDFLATLIPNLRACFPNVNVLRWLGDVDRNLSRSNTRKGSHSSENDVDAMYVHISGIRIENRAGERLELDWLLVR